MPCTRINNGFICSSVDSVHYFNYDNKAYKIVFSKRDGPLFYKGDDEIEMYVEFNDNDEPISNKFLWDMFEDWYYKKD